MESCKDGRGLERRGGGSAKAHGMEEEGEITHAASGITAL